MKWSSIQDYKILLHAGSLAAACFTDSQFITGIFFDILPGVKLTLDATPASFLRLYGLVSFIFLLCRLSNTPAPISTHGALQSFGTRIDFAFGCFVTNDLQRFQGSYELSTDRSDG